jgi:hypothetical protein
VVVSEPHRSPYKGGRCRREDGAETTRKVNTVDREQGDIPGTLAAAQWSGFGRLKDRYLLQKSPDGEKDVLWLSSREIA